MIRPPAVAGTFYPGDSLELQRMIADLVPETKEKRKVRALVAPHAGYVYSGAVAGKTFARAQPAPTYIACGPNHAGMGADFSLMHEGIWQTPLGDVAIDDRLAADIYSQDPVIEPDSLAHQREHSIEVQLPFLQFLADGFAFVPLAVRHYAPDDDFLGLCRRAATAIASAVKGRGDDIVLVASTDFSHYESHEHAAANDRKAIDAILALDAKRLFSAVADNDISMCGFGSVAVVVEAAKALGASKAELVDYKTSGDVTGDKSAVVGYAGIVIE